MYTIRSIILVAPFLLSRVSCAASVCYFPDHNTVAPSGYGPCNSTADGEFSACCDLGNSACSTTGYCYGSAGYMYRGACTDKTWNSPACPGTCSDGTKPLLTPSIISPC